MVCCAFAASTPASRRPSWFVSPPAGRAQSGLRGGAWGRCYPGSGPKQVMA